MVRIGCLCVLMTRKEKCSLISKISKMFIIAALINHNCSLTCQFFLPLKSLKAKAKTSIDTKLGIRIIKFWYLCTTRFKGGHRIYYAHAVVNSVKRRKGHRGETLCCVTKISSIALWSTVSYVCFGACDVIIMNKHMELSLMEFPFRAKLPSIKQPL